MINQFSLVNNKFYINKLTFPNEKRKSEKINLTQITLNFIDNKDVSL